MFYAVEYAYGSTVVNNGPRADRVLRFTQKRLQVAWVQAGSDYADQPGYRSIIGARNPLVRKADYLEDGDIEAYEVIARERVSNSPKLRPYRHELIDYDWRQPRHWQWVATRKESEVLNWAQRVREQAAEAVE
jgi:hypothetical protein